MVRTPAADSEDPTATSLRFAVALVNGAALAMATVQALALGEALALTPSGATGFAQLYAAVDAAARGMTPYGAAGTTGPGSLVPPFALPPAALLLFGPLLLIDPAASRWQWTALQLVALAVALGVLVHQSGLRWPRRVPALFALLVLVFPPLHAALRVGDIEVLLLLLLVGAWALARRGRAVRAGLLLGLATALWPALLVLAVPWLVWREWRGPATMLGTALLVNALALLLVGPAAGGGYLVALTRLAPDWLGHPANAALAGLARLTTNGAAWAAWIAAPALGAAATILGAATAAVALAWLAARAAARRDLAWAAAVVVALLVGPLAMPAMLVLLAMPLVLALRALPLRIDATWALLALGVAGTVAGPQLVDAVAPGGRPLAGPALALSLLPTLSLVALLALFIALACRPAVPFLRQR
jgi:hypothetical protein